jgi:hypothetical protein
LPSFDESTGEKEETLKRFKNSEDGLARMLSHCVEGITRFIAGQEDDPGDER